MVQIKTALTKHTQSLEAFRQLKESLHSKPKLLLFFSSTTQDFDELTAFFHDAYPSSEVLGLTTVGEIGPHGISEHGVSAMSFDGASFAAKGVMIKDIVKYPVFYRNDLIKGLDDIGIDRNSMNPEKEGLGLVFPNGLLGAEEKMLSVVNSVFSKGGFPIFGGTAGDDEKFKETLVSYNGEVSNTAGLTVFIKMGDDFLIRKENIFQPTGKKMKITKSDTESRTVYEMNGNRATSEYARLLGVPESALSRYFMSNPLGRAVNEEVFIASPFQAKEDGSIEFYCQIFQDAVVEILEPKNPVVTLKKTVEAFKGEFERLDGAIGINCILRKMQFKDQRIIPELNKELEKIPNLGGFCSYGEQLNNTQLNQTLILLGIGKRK